MKGGVARVYRREINPIVVLVVVSFFTSFFPLH